METNKMDYQGWMAHDRGVDAVAVSGWRKRSERVLKVEIKEQLANACGYGLLLVQHWGKNRMRPEAVEFYEACILCYDNEMYGHFLSGSVLEEWFSKDWRGVKGQRPLPMQLFERALMVKQRLIDEQEAERHRAPVALRISLLDGGALR